MSHITHHCLFTDDVRVEARQNPHVPDAVSVTLHDGASSTTLTLSPAQWRVVVEAVLPYVPVGEVTTDV